MINLEAPAISIPRIVPRRHPIRSGVICLALVAVVWVGAAVVLNENMRWDIVLEYMFSTPILNGLVGTVQLTIASMLFGTVLGTALAALRLSSSAVLSRLAATYVALVRSVPLLVQLIFWFNLGLVFPRIGIVLPGSDWGLSVPTNDLVSAFVASMIGLVLHESALMAEIIRGGLLSVPKGQAEAARTLGMNETKILFRIIIPQAMRAILPATGNQLISLMKATAMVAFIGGGDLMTAAQDIYSRNFLVIPLLIVVTVWYLVLTLVASVAQHFLETYYGRGFHGAR